MDDFYVEDIKEDRMLMHPVLLEGDWSLLICSAKVVFRVQANHPLAGMFLALTLFRSNTNPFLANL
jgi:hypothetical protein